MRTILTAMLALWCLVALAPAQAADTAAPAAPAATQAADDETEPAEPPGSDLQVDEPALGTEGPTEEAKEIDTAPAEEAGPPGRFPAPTPATRTTPAQGPTAAPTQPAEESGKPAEEAPAPTPAPAAATPAQVVTTPPWNHYQLLVVDNIFSRNRGPRPVVRTPPRNTYRPPERYLVLKGIVGQSDGYVAFVEDTRTNATTVCRVGDAVGLGRITAITATGLTYELNGTGIQAAVGDYVGSAVAGGTEAAAAPTTAAAAPGAAPAASPAASAGTAAPLPGAGSMSIEERLRLRRQQEEGK